MSYRCRNPKSTIMVQLSADGTQTAAADGDKILFPTKTTTGSDGVSISSGTISLDSSKTYYLSVHVDCNRPSTTSDFSAEWWNETSSTQLGKSDGAFEARWLPTGAFYYNGSTLGQLTLVNPTFDISVRVNRLGASNTANISQYFHLFIIEIDD